MPDIASRPYGTEKSGTVKLMQVEDLLGNDREIGIILQGAEYRLPVSGVLIQQFIENGAVLEAGVHTLAIEGHDAVGCVAQ